MVRDGAVLCAINDDILQNLKMCLSLPANKGWYSGQMLFRLYLGLLGALGWRASELDRASSGVNLSQDLIAANMTTIFIIRSQNDSSIRFPAEAFCVDIHNSYPAHYH
jgi:hypothetical protein